MIKGMAIFYKINDKKKMLNAENESVVLAFA